jgi:hypothetical protein
MLGSLWRWVEIESELKQKNKEPPSTFSIRKRECCSHSHGRHRQSRQRSTVGDIDIGIGRCAFVWTTFYLKLVRLNEHPNTHIGGYLWHIVTIKDATFSVPRIGEWTREKIEKKQRVFPLLKMTKRDSLVFPADLLFSSCFICALVWPVSYLRIASYAQTVWRVIMSRRSSLLWFRI